jgi:putative transposase
MGPVLLDRALNALHTSYTKHVNEDRNREGTLFRSRTGTDRILDDSYLMQVVPYIHKNPVEVIVNVAPNWPWSTYSLYRGEGWDGPDLASFKYPPHFQG